MPYEWVGPGSLTRVHGEDVEPGDTFEPSESERNAFGGKMEQNTNDESESVETPDKADTEDLSEMDYSELRQRAVDADTDEINGRSSKDDIISYFEE